jgi:hypothetical protein
LRVQNALDEQGVSYELIKEPVLPRSRRKDVIALTGQERLPVVEFADGSAYREESSDMAATVRAGQLFEKSSGASAASSTPPADA